MALRYKWFSSPSFAIPLKSPLISIKTGMPNLITVQIGLEWFCFPVPVTQRQTMAFKVFKGTFYVSIWQSLLHLKMAPPSNAFPLEMSFRICLVKSSFFTHNKFVI
jgi:hypothetical protein